MTQAEFTNALGKLGCIDTYLDVIDCLEPHFSTEEMDQLKKEPIFFYLGACEADQDRIWNAMECRKSMWPNITPAATLKYQNFHHETE